MEVPKEFSLRNQEQKLCVKLLPAKRKDPNVKMSTSEEDNMNSRHSLSEDLKIPTLQEIKQQKPTPKPRYSLQDKNLETGNKHPEQEVRGNLVPIEAKDPYVLDDNTEKMPSDEEEDMNSRRPVSDENLDETPTLRENMKQQKPTPKPRYSLQAKIPETIHEHPEKKQCMDHDAPEAEIGSPDEDETPILQEKSSIPKLRYSLKTEIPETIHEHPDEEDIQKQQAFDSPTLKTLTKYLVSDEVPTSKSEQKERSFPEDAIEFISNKPEIDSPFITEVKEEKSCVRENTSPKAEFGIASFGKGDVTEVQADLSFGEEFISELKAKMCCQDDNPNPETEFEIQVENTDTVQSDSAFVRKFISELKTKISASPETELGIRSSDDVENPLATVTSESFRIDCTLDDIIAKLSRWRENTLQKAELGIGSSREVINLEEMCVLKKTSAFTEEFIAELKTKIPRQDENLRPETELGVRSSDEVENPLDIVTSEDIQIDCTLDDDLANISSLGENTPQEAELGIGSSNQVKTPEAMCALKKTSAFNEEFIAEPKTKLPQQVENVRPETELGVRSSDEVKNPLAILTCEDIQIDCTLDDVIAHISSLGENTPQKAELGIGSSNEVENPEKMCVLKKTSAFNEEFIAELKTKLPQKVENLRPETELGIRSYNEVNNPELGIGSSNEVKTPEPTCILKKTRSNSGFTEELISELKTKLSRQDENSRAKIMFRSSDKVKNLKEMVISENIRINEVKANIPCPSQMLVEKPGAIVNKTKLDSAFGKEFKTKMSHQGGNSKPEIGLKMLSPNEGDNPKAMVTSVNTELKFLSTNGVENPEVSCILKKTKLDSAFGEGLSSVLKRKISCHDENVRPDIEIGKISKEMFALKESELDEAKIPCSGEDTPQKAKFGIATWSELQDQKEMCVVKKTKSVDWNPKLEILPYNEMIPVGKSNTRRLELEHPDEITYSEAVVIFKKIKASAVLDEECALKDVQHPHPDEKILEIISSDEVENQEHILKKIQIDPVFYKEFLLDMEEKMPSLDPKKPVEAKVINITPEEEDVAIGIPTGEASEENDVEISMEANNHPPNVRFSPESVRVSVLIFWVCFLLICIALAVIVLIYGNVIRKKPTIF